jgi:ribosomal protein S18 acetylase RimI-like enzyme
MSGRMSFILVKQSSMDAPALRALNCSRVSMALIADVQRALMEGGTKTLVTRSLRKLVRPAVKIGTLVFSECDLREPMPERQVIPGITVREATLNDAHLFEDRESFFERLREGSRCFMGIEDATGKLTNYRWINTSAAYVPELKRYMVFRPNEAYAYDLNTLPEFRRRGIDRYTRHHTYSYLREHGYTKLYAYIHGDNYVSLQAARHLLRPIARVWYIQIRGCNPIMIGGRKRGLPQLSPATPSSIPPLKFLPD